MPVLPDCHDHKRNYSVHNLVPKAVLGHFLLVPMHGRAEFRERPLIDDVEGVPCAARNCDVWLLLLRWWVSFRHHFRSPEHREYPEPLRAFRRHSLEFYRWFPASTVYPA